MKDVPDVAPSAGAWIEIPYSWTGNMEEQVAPSAGAWIEISVIDLSTISAVVAPSAGAWIEIFAYASLFHRVHRRSLRGSVD